MLPPVALKFHQKKTCDTKYITDVNANNMHHSLCVLKVKVSVEMFKIFPSVQKLPIQLFVSKKN